MQTSMITAIPIPWQQRPAIDPEASRKAAERHHKIYARFFTDMLHFHGIKGSREIHAKDARGHGHTPIPDWNLNPGSTSLPENKKLVSSPDSVLSWNWHRNVAQNSRRAEEQSRFETRLYDNRVLHELHQKNVEAFYTQNQRNMIAIREKNKLQQTDQLQQSRTKALLSTKDYYLLLKETKTALEEYKGFVDDQKISPKQITIFLQHIPKDKDLSYLYNYYVNAMRSEFGIPRERVSKIFRKISYTFSTGSEIKLALKENIQKSLNSLWTQRSHDEKNAAEAELLRNARIAQHRSHEQLFAVHPHERPMLFTQNHPIPPPNNNVHAIDLSSSRKENQRIMCNKVAIAYFKM